MIVYNSKHPELIAAIAEVESNYNSSAIGDGGDSIGMFQIQPRWWGSVDITSIPNQVVKANTVLTELIASKGTLSKAVVAYNGSGYKARSYATKVLAVSKSIHYTVKNPF